jgi:transcriptional regulator GlxA family with amidase domain
LESTVRNPRVQIVIDFINDNLQRKISLTELTQVANLSASHLTRLFKTHTGLTPGEYLRRLRMEKARHLIATSVLSIKQIMALAGYNNKTHFGRHFRRSFDLSPSEYRRRNSTF